MRIENIYLRQFRNHKALSLKFDKGINAIVGPNASGKTNVVEAIYYLSLARSFRGVDDNELVSYEKEYAEISTDVIEGDIKRHIYILISEKGRSVVINNKKVSKVSTLAKYLNVLLFEPKDVLLFKSSPKDRRNFLDISISKRFPIYLDYMSHYEKVLKTRNDVLKSGEVNQELLDANTELLVKYAAPIVAYREQFCKDINDILNKIARTLIGTRENLELEIHYEPFVKNTSNIEEDALKLYKRSLEADLKQKATTIGIHREDFSISLSGKEIGTYGSQGENRLVALALKLSPYFLYEDRDKQPIVVLDDVMSELDSKHQKLLVNFLQKLGQVFITGTKLEIDGATQIKIQNTKEVF